MSFDGPVSVPVLAKKAKKPDWTGLPSTKHSTLKKLGGRIQLGHVIGEPCPLPTPAFGDSFTVIDINGIHDIGLDFCGCGRHGIMAQQLLRFRLYPATAQNPNTATTFRALHHFQLLNFESKCSVYEFH